MRPRVVAIAVFTLVLSAVVGYAALSRGSGPAAGANAEQHRHQPEQQLPQDDGALQIVESKYVCMINNQRFNKVQIPVEVEGRTYYGCCEMCKGKLDGDPKSRVAVDPVSGKEVDKAKAVIGVDVDGAAYYFESAENLKRFKPQS